MSHDQNQTIDPDLAQTEISEELKQEIALFRTLKPYLGHCLTLNHDINNLLSGILGYAEYMLTERDQLTPSQKSSLQQIMACAEKIKKVTDNLSEHKIALSEKIDMESITAAYKKIARPLD